MRVSAILFLFLTSFSAMSADLPETIKKQLLSNGSALITEDRDSAWPAITSYTLISSSPQEAAATFFDVESHKTFLPGMLESRITKAISSTQFEVLFKVRIPFIGSEESNALINETSYVSKEQKFVISWKQIISPLVESPSSLSVEGQAAFLPYGGKTLLIYKNYIVPKSSFARLIRTKAINSMQATIDSIKREVERLKREDAETLKRKVENLSQALSI